MLNITHIDGQILKKMIIAGANKLDANKQLVDSLNVFPIPDGDTGTNMSMTALMAAREVLALETDNIYEVAKAAAGGALKGARGNSGVILSQLFRGFSKSLEGKATADCDDIADAMCKAVEMAYKAVMKPKEGTMLTVARIMAEKASDFTLDSDDIAETLTEVLKAGNEILLKTTEMLPQLKQANVIDSGGKGVMLIFEGAFLALTSPDGLVMPEAVAPVQVSEDFSAIEKVGMEDITFIYDVEFFINVSNIPPETEGNFKKYLEQTGDSIVVVGDEELVKVHVHTDHPGDVLETALKIGSLTNIKIENMLDQHTNIVNSEKQTEEPISEPKDTAFITVSAGEGFEELFKHLDADFIIEGGQTMNPSTEDFLSAIERTNAKSIIILPNNKNILLSAKQAAELTSGKDVHVLETRSIPQGLAAMINYMPESSIEHNLERMAETIAMIKTGHVTYAVRDSSIDGHDIKEGDILSILGDKIIAVSDNIQQAANDLVSRMIEDGSSDLISIYYGQDTTAESAEELKEFINEQYPDCETEVYEGKQPIYYYTISSE